MKEVIEQIVEEKMEVFAVRLQYAFRAELDRAINNLRGVKSGVDIEGEQCLKSSAVCSLLDISESTLYRMRKSNQIGFVLKNGTYYYKAKDVLSFLDKDYVSSVEETVKKRSRKSRLSLFD